MGIVVATAPYLTHVINIDQGWEVRKGWTAGSGSERAMQYRMEEEARELEARYNDAASEKDSIEKEPPGPNV